MKPARQAVALGAAAFLLFLIVNIPADWLLQRMTGQLQNVHLSGVSGGIVSGHASRMDLEGATLQDLRWRWRPLMLVLGRIEYNLEARWQGAPVQMRAGTGVMGGSYLHHVKAALPAATLAGALALPVELYGQVDLDLKSVRFGRPDEFPALEGGVQWSGSGSSAPVVLDLGSVHLDFTPDHSLTHGKVTAREGQLLVDGTLELTPAGEYVLNAEMQPNGPLPDDLRSGLEAVAEFRDGRYQFEWSGNLKR